MATRQPLKNKVVLLLRIKLGSEAKRLKALGAKVIHCPILNLKSFNTSSFQLLASNTSFDWILFTSATGVKLFKNRFRILPKNCRVAAIGPETARTLRQAFGRSADFTPSVFTTEDLARELPLSLKKRNVLLIRSKNADKRMEAILTRRGACLGRLSLYEVMPKRLGAAIKSGLEKGEITHVFFGSASQARAFAGNFTAGQLSEIFKKNKVHALAIGPETSKALKGLNVKHQMAQEHTFDGMIDSLHAS